MRYQSLISIVFRGVSLIIWMGVIFFFSSLSGSPDVFDPPISFYIERKGAHIIEYLVLFLLAVRFFFVIFPRGALPSILSLAFVFSVMYGVSDEFHQSLVPYRGPKSTDVLIDASGALLGAGFYSLFYRIKNGSFPIKKDK